MYPLEFEDSKLFAFTFYSEICLTAFYGASVYLGFRLACLFWDD